MKRIDKPMFESDRGEIFKTAEKALEDDILFYASKITDLFNMSIDNRVSKDDLLEALCSSDNIRVIEELADAHAKLDFLVVK